MSNWIAIRGYMLTRGLCVFLWFLLAALWGNAQALFTGEVRNESQELLPGAHVLVNDSLALVTDLYGKFTLEKAGTYTITLSFVGYKKSTFEFKVTGLPGQTRVFTLSAIQLAAAIIEADDQGFEYRYSPSVDATTLYAAKKTEIVLPNSVPANLATNNARQAFAQIAGLTIWESDAAGLQLGIGGRGLNPNRSSNFNTRQNGYDISADPLGYPESYYSPALQAVERIVVVRGAAALQFGPQFGGMVNFKLMEAPKDQKVAVRTEQTIGSYGLLSSFNQVGGSINKLSYHFYTQLKQGNGWRDNSGFNSKQFFGKLSYSLHPRFKLSAEFTHMHYLAQQPGGLTDKQFLDDPSQSLRARNWFRVDWNLAAISATYQPNKHNLIESQVYGLHAGRDALGFLGLITRLDPEEERDLISGKFNNIGTETKWRNTHYLFNLPQTLVVGMRYFSGNTNALQSKAENGSGPSFVQIDATNFAGSNYDFHNQNIAAFSEYVLRITPKLSVVPGMRYEFLKTSALGNYTEILTDGAGNILPTYPRTIQESSSNARKFLLAGIGISWKPKRHVEVYSNISQNYRGVNFSDIRIQNPKQVVDPNIHDERGYTADVGLRLAQGKALFIDFSVFRLSYEDKIGNRLDTITTQASLGPQTVQVRSNLGDALIQGVEMVAEVNWNQLLHKTTSSLIWRTFVNGALINASYSENAENAIAGKVVEFVPGINLKTGIRLRYNSLEMSYQYSYVGEQYTDATNAGFQSDPNAIVGAIPAYWVHDLSLKYSFKQWMIQCGVNNLWNHSYFTRRAAAYPGPGIIPAEARSFYFTLGWSMWD